MSPVLRHLAVAAVIGLAAGLLTQVGQGVLPHGWRSAANSITPWLAVAFATGALAPTRTAAVAGGVVALLAALAGYYGLVWLRFGYGPSLGGMTILWTIGAVVGGPVFGVAGRWWRETHPWRRAVGPALLGAAAIAEGLYLSRIESVAEAAPGFVVAGLLVPLVLGRTWGDRGRSYAALVPCLVAGGAGFVATLALSSLITGV